LKLSVITLQNAPWPELTARWRKLEELGVETIWVADHLGSKMIPPGGPWWEAWSCLTALAYETTTPRIGPLVSPMTFRNPAVLARQAVTVATISGGRLELGLGHRRVRVGSRPRRSAVRNREGTRRPVRRVDRAAAGAARGFRPGLEIPLTLAGRGPTILRLAARHAVRWNTFSGIGVELDEALLRGREDNAKLDALCAETGRTVIPETPWRSDQAFAEVVERWRAVGFDEIVFYYPPDTNMPDSTVTPGVFERAFTAP
jgi:alkanesulfonate monooxygenase SsuD/methylene tetrahydromethanopterin reductase-like flavin-dependent oxidoreductase (luciferase family)